MAILIGSPGDDNVRLGGTSLIGTSGDDNIFGLAGNDNLDGGRGGIDFLDGGAGNDTLFVAGSSGSGSVLDGGDGDDSLSAEDADDRLVGGAGNDTLIGGFGRNALIGGAGNDFYALTHGGGIDSANVDTIIEDANGGIDTIEARINFRLPDNIENLILKDGVFGIGNELNNSITHKVESGSSVTNNTFRGLGGNDSLSGGVGRDSLAGGEGNDVLVGGAGNDRLVGGAGADGFAFFAVNEGIDTIVDFRAIDDSILVSASGFGGGLKASRAAISPNQFRLGSAAADASDRFIYNNKGLLFFDVDGVGRAAQVQIATLVGAPTLSAADIIV